MKCPAGEKYSYSPNSVPPLRGRSTTGLAQGRCRPFSGQIRRRLWFPVLLGILGICGTAAFAADAVVLGVATSLTSLEGHESLLAVELAAGEINARGGVQVGERRLPLQVRSVDLRGALPGMPVSEALKRLKTLVVDKKVHAIMVGLFRSEVLLAGMELITRHRVPLLSAITLSPAVDAKVLKDPRYKDIFRVCLISRYLADYLINTMKFLQKRYHFRKVYIMNQDVAWARTTASLLVKLYFDRSDWQIVGPDTYPSGASDFTTGLAAAEARRADVILPVFDMPKMRFHLIDFRLRSLQLYSAHKRTDHSHTDRPAPRFPIPGPLLTDRSCKGEIR